MSLLLITKRGTSKKITDEEINVNWAGDKFKEFQEKTKDHIFFKKRRKTVISATRGTQRKYLEKAERDGNREDMPELFYYMGRVYHLEHDFLFATASYSTYMAEALPPGKQGKLREKEVQVYIQQCEEGDTILIHGGVYREVLNINKSDICIKGFSNEKVIITGTQEVRNWTEIGKNYYKAYCKKEVLQLFERLTHLLNVLKHNWFPL